MMRKTVVLAIACLVFSACSQEQYTLTGEYSGLTGKMMYIEVGGMKIDSSEIVDRRFAFRGSVEAPTYCMVRSDDNKFGFMFWIENSDITIAVENQQVQVNGSQTEDEYQAYRKHMASVWDEGRIKNQEASEAYKAGDITGYEQARAEVERLGLKEDSVMVEFVKAYPRSYISLNHIYNCTVMDKYGFDRLNAMVRYLDTTAFTGEQWEVFSQRYNTLKRFMPGNEFPDFAQKDVFDTEVRLSDYRGKYVLLTFSGSWEKSYRASNPLRLKLYEQYKGKGLEMLDVMLEAEKEGIVKVVANDGLPWNLISEYNGWENSVVKTFMIEHITVNSLIDPEGKIVALNLFGDALAQKLSELFE